MDAPRLRPTFVVPLDVPREVAVQRIRDGLVKRDDLQGRWRGRGRWAEIFVSEDEKRFWSPHLSVRVDGTPDGSSLFGRFAPHPELWTFVMFVYIGVAFLVVFGATLGYVQWASDEPAWGLWAVWLGVPTLGLVHLAGAVGQRLGQEQMRSLRTTLWEVLDEVFDLPKDSANGG